MRVSFSARLTWPAPENALSVLRAELHAKGAPILDFSESNPTRVGLGMSPDKLGFLLDPANASYAPDPRGLPRAREALAEDYRMRGGRPGGVDPHGIFLCASTSEAYGWLFKLLCDPGDAVLVPKPGYPLFDHLAGLEAVEARPYRLEYAHPAGWRIDLDVGREGDEGGPGARPRPHQSQQPHGLLRGRPRARDPRRALRTPWLRAHRRRGLQ